MHRPSPLEENSTGRIFEVTREQDEARTRARIEPLV